MTGIALTAAGPAHAALIAELHRATVGDTWSAESVARLLALPGAFACVAQTAEAESVGAILCIPGGEGLEVASFGVLPEARGRGVGRALLGRAIAHAVEAGAGRLFLEVRADNRRARRLYERAGFTVEGRRRNYYAPRAGRPGADAILMQHALTGRFGGNRKTGAR